MSLLFTLVVMIGFCAPKAAAQDQLYEKSGAAGLYDSLDKETQKLLDQAGVEDAQVTCGLTGDNLFQILSGLLQEKLTAPLKALASILALVVMGRLCGCLEEGDVAGTAQFVGTAACGIIIIGPIVGLMSSCQRVISAAAAFLTAAVPVYAGLLVAVGRPAAGSGYSVLAMAAGAAIPLLCEGFLLPLIQIYLAFSIASAVAGARLEPLADSLYGLGKWALVTAVTAFCGVLSVQTALNTQVDAATGKAAKLVLSSGIPIVGGTLGDAVAAIQNSVGIVKSGVGAFGILAALCIFAPAMIECALWTGVCLAGKAAGELFQAGKAGALLGAAASGAKMLLAILASVCTVCVVSAAAVLFVQGG